MTDEKSYQNTVTDEKIGEGNQQIVMDEKFMENDAMDEQLMEDGLMDAKIGPKVVMDLSIFKIGGWNNFATQRSTVIENVH